MSASTAYRIQGVGPTDYFGCRGNEAVVRPELVLWEDEQGGAHNYDMCYEVNDESVFRFHCCWELGHSGPHDAWFEGDGTHVARWRNKLDPYLILEEEELAL